MTHHPIKFESNQSADPQFALVDSESRLKVGIQGFQRTHSLSYASRVDHQTQTDASLRRRPVQLK